MSEWKEYKLGDFIKVKHGYAFPGEHITPTETDKILVTPGNFHIGGGFKSDKFKFFDDNDFPQEYILHGGDIVVTMTDLSKDTDTLGYSAKIPFNSGKVFLHNQRIGLLQFKSDKVWPDYIYWLMRTREFQSYIVGSASGTSIMHTSPSRIESYECAFPSLDEQKRIAGVLSSLDDKIDLLHRENATLEALAETLFRHYFIENPNPDWKEGKLENVVDVLDYRRKPLSKMERDKMKNGNILYPYYGAAEIMDYIDEYLFDGEFILLGEDGTVRTDNGYPILQLATGKFWPNNHAHVLQAKKPFDNCFLWYYFKTTNIDEIVTGAVQPKINQANLMSLPIYDYPIDQVEEFQTKAVPIWNKIKYNQQQIKTLVAQRDILLPCLMSGEIVVK